MNTKAYRRPAQNGLRVKTIDTYTEFLAIEIAWKALEDRDPETCFFLSWDWLDQAFRDNLYRWSVLVVYATGSGSDGEDEIVGLLPLKYGVHWSTTRNEFQTEIEGGGRLIFSEYTGFLCTPEQEPAVMEALARALRLMPWSKLSIRYVAQIQRAKLFCAAFERLGYPVTWKEYRINNGEVDNLICPHVPLPEDFETYLQASVSSSAREQYCRFKQEYLVNGDYHFTHSDADSFENDVSILMDFWNQKWSARKGRTKSNDVAANFTKVLAAALKTEALFLPVLWRGDTPLAALGHVMDPKNGAMHFIIAGRDETAEEAFIGAALHFHSIECAILLGCQYYDFGHGDQKYKFSYGAERTKVEYFSISRPEKRADNVFDSISTGVALKRVESFIKAGKTEQARRACKQLSQLFK